MTFFIYRIFYKTFRFILCFFSFLFPEKIRNIINDRKNFKIIWRIEPQDQPIWFHCASGEIEYIKPLLRKLKTDYPDKKLFLTYFSSTGKSLTENAVFQTFEADGCAPLPWDEPDLIQKFLIELNPKLLVVSRTDLWPELLIQCHIKNIPTVLVAATFAPGSKKMSSLGKIFLSLSLPLFNKICVVSEEDKEMIQTLFPKLNFFITGDPRFDQVYYRIQNQKKELPKSIVDWSKESVWIAGSTWPEDEAVIIPTIKKWNTQNIISTTNTSIQNPKVILIPHDTDAEHIISLTNQLKKVSLHFELFSELVNEKINSKTEVLVFDKKGYLLDLYRLTHLAFIGGSFKRQVHSVMEALGQGCIVLVGPHHLNNREAIEFQRIKVNSFPLVNCVHNTEEFYQALTKYLPDKKQIQMPEYNLKNLIQEKFNLKSKATEKTFKEIEEYL
jgi:3-deoxy-D-manno-octulosonic-acid transferase